MSRVPPPGRGVRAPRAWLGVAFLGVWLYFLSQLMQLYKDAFAQAAALSVADSIDLLRLTSNLGQSLFFAGIAAALWRANLAAGLTSAGVRGLVIASAGVSVLLLFELVLLLAWFHMNAGAIAALGEAYGIGSVMGVALGLAGVASLGVGLTEAVGLFGNAAEEPSTKATAPEKLG